MEQNVGELDRTARIALGAIAGGASLAILGGIISTSSLAAAVLGIVSVVLFVTATTRTCGAYSLIGVNTCERN